MIHKFKSDHLNQYFMNIRNEFPDDIINYPSEIYSSLEQRVVKQSYDLQNSLQDSLENIRQNLQQSLDTNILENSLESSIISDISIPEKDHSIIEPRLRVETSKKDIEINLISTQNFEQTFKLINKSSMRVNLKLYFRDNIEGIHIVAPHYINSQSFQDIQIQIGEIEQLGDIFNSLIIEATANKQKQIIDIPFTVHFRIPKLKLEYQGGNELLSYKSNKFIHIKLKENIFKEYTFHLSSAEQIQISLETPYSDGSNIFPDQLYLINNEKRKINLRTRQQSLCIVAKIKKTSLAFIFKVSVY